MYFTSSPDSISLLKRDFELSDKVLRTLVVKIDKIKEPKSEEETQKPPEEIEPKDDNTDTESKEKNPEPVASE